MYFGKACKEYREEMNISQEKFALSIGMDRTYYSSVEAGKRNVSIQNSHEQNSTHSVFMRVCEAWQPLLSLQIYSNNQLQMV